MSALLAVISIPAHSNVNVLRVSVMNKDQLSHTTGVKVQQDKYP